MLLTSSWVGASVTLGEASSSFAVGSSAFGASTSGSAAGAGAERETEWSLDHSFICIVHILWHGIKWNGWFCGTCYCMLPGRFKKAFCLICTLTRCIVATVNRKTSRNWDWPVSLSINYIDYIVCNGTMAVASQYDYYSSSWCWRSASNWRRKTSKNNNNKNCYLGEKNSVQTLGYGLSNIKQHPEKEKQVCMYLQRLVCVGVSEFPSSPLPQKSLSLSKVHWGTTFYFRCQQMSHQCTDWAFDKTSSVDFILDLS